MFRSDAGVAHPVERHLAKVEVASSSLVTRSIKKKQLHLHLLLFCFVDKRREQLREQLNAIVRWTIACRQLDGGNSIVYQIPPAPVRESAHPQE